MPEDWDTRRRSEWFIEDETLGQKNASQNNSIIEWLPTFWLIFVHLLVSILEVTCPLGIYGDF